MMFFGTAFRNPDTLPTSWPGLNAAPAIVKASGNATVPITNPPTADTNQVTALPTPLNVQNSPAASTVVTAGATSLLAKAQDIISNPSQHVFAIIALLVAGWFAWKHWK